ncbi:ABC transporter permease subunit [Shigella flexneri]|nr:ABC transporter permease subunit [Shigella flexneri]
MTVWYTALVVAGSTVLGLAVAMFFNREFRLRKTARSLVILSYVTPSISLVFAWKYMFNNGYGIVNYLGVDLLHLYEQAPLWFDNPGSSFVLVVLFAIWRYFPYAFISFLAILQTIDKSLYEAAEMDGANAWQRFLIITLFPFFVMLMTSFKSAKEAISLHPTLLPQQWTLEHYVDIFNPMIFPFVDYFRNSMVVSVVSSVVAVFLGILGAYALSRLRFKGRMTINASFYTVYMFSGILLVVPLFKIITALGIYDTEMALIITMVTQTLPTAVFMLKSYFDTIPDEIEEAAMMDGLNRLQIIFRITVPLAMSGLISVFVYCFMVAWNDYLFASIFLSSASNFTLPVGLNALFSTPDYIWGRMMAASLVTALPVVIMYALSERFIKSGLTAGGVKG